MTTAGIDARVEKRFWAKTDRPTLRGCWLWKGAYNRPGERFRQRFNGGVSRRPVFKISKEVGVVYAHRLALSIADGVPLFERVGLEACHRPECGNYECVNPAHLYWGTPEQNRADRYGVKESATCGE